MPVKITCRPVDLKGLLAIKAAHPAAKLVVGNSEVGIEMKFKNAGYPVLVGTTHVPELNQIQVRHHPRGNHFIVVWPTSCMQFQPYLLSSECTDGSKA